MTKETEEIKPEVKKPGGVAFWIGRFFLILLALFLTLMIIIEIPFVQMWGAGRVSRIIAKNLKTDVSIGGFSLNPISDLTLKDVFIGSPDSPEDTLIKVNMLQVDFKNLWDLFSNRLTINQVVLEYGLLNIEKKEGDSLSNLDLALIRMFPSNKDTSAAPFQLDLDKISGNQLRVVYDDNTTGMLVSMFFPRADIELDSMDLGGKFMDISDLDFDKPIISITSKPVKVVLKHTISPPGRPWAFDVDALNWTDGQIYVDNQNKVHDTSQVHGLDYAHMNLVDVDLHLDSLQVRGTNVKAKDVMMHLLHENGFELETFSISEADISSSGINLKDLVLQTKKSLIKNSVKLTYSGYDDFKTFEDSVQLNIPAADIKLHINDLNDLFPVLSHVTFFSDNKDKDIVLQGNINGIVNRLKILNMNAGLGGITLTGDFRSRDLAHKGSQLLSLDLDRSKFSAASLKDLFPDMNLPPLVYKLGQINFTGKFDGYPDNFVAFGKFNTSLGGLTLDMNLNTINGIAKGKYSGAISLDNFDIGKLIDQPDIGTVTMTGRVIDGTGLTPESLSADLSTVISSITYKKYTYQNIRLEGQISGKLFNGTLDINDPNMVMHFEGNVDLKGERPKLDFITRIDSVRFSQLGFGDIPVSISGIFDVNLTAGNIDKFHGSLFGENVRATIKGVNYALDSVSILALIDSVTNDRFYSFESDVISGTFSGVFDPISFPNQLQQYLHDQYPSAVDAPKKIVTAPFNQRFSWDVHIHDSQQWLDLAGIQGLVIKNAHTRGTLNLKEQETTGYFELPELHYAGVNVYGSTINFTEKSGRADLDLEMIAADLKENLFFEDVLVSGTATDDSIRMRVKTDDIADIIKELDLEINADPENGLWTFSFNPIRLVMLDDNWTMPSSNRVQIQKGGFNLENLELNSGDRKIVVNDIDNKGIEAFITGFDVSYLNSLWINDKFRFSGTYTLDLSIDNVYNIRQFNTMIHIPALRVNDKPYGDWTVNAFMNDPKDSVKIDLSMNMRGDEVHLSGKGAYLPPINSIPKENQNYLRLDLVGQQFPLDFIEFFLGGNVHDTEGSVDFTLNIEGKTNKLNPRGKGRVYNGSTTINYLGTAYSFHDQPFEITETEIDMTGDKLYDVEGNSATIQGGLTHRYFRDFGVKATITSPRIIGLDVTSEENVNFYGKGVGAVVATFSGPIANLKMVIDLVTARGTHLYIPLSGSKVNTDKDFVVFLQNGLLPASKINTFKLSGIDLTLKISITDEAQVDIIFDDNTGEVLRGIGSGDLQINMSRSGNLSMQGNYTIKTGDYLFTNFAIVRKQFELLEGGKIRWDGDPYDATINIRAKYKDLRASIKPLIEEYLVNNTSLTEQANERVEINLIMILTGSLLHPNIAFEIEFPTLTGELKGFVETKIRALKTNENAMNEQVMGLLITRSFLPTTSGVSLNVSKGLTSTLGDLISSTLSNYLGGFLRDLIQSDVISIDLNVAVDLPNKEGNTVGEGQDFYDNTASEYYVNLPIGFFNDRLQVNVGGNYVSGSSLEASNNGQYFAGDITFEYKLTPDGRLKIRAYNRNEVTFEGRKNKVGLGLAYRREYDSLPEIFAGKKKKQKIVETNPSGG
ncbi:MAG TPA: translocation/assembly module TamB domain-containing protein [Saprospiraceae bacterium]|nr:translocation/assembly module TamB domain-containing protein [Saprospiraceae bacterium]